MPIELGSFSLGAGAGSLITVVASHYLAKSRDAHNRHIETFNREADALAQVLREEMECPHSGCQPDFAGFRRVLKKRELARFDIAVDTYNYAKANAVLTLDQVLQGDLVRISAHSSYIHPAPIVAAVNRLLEFTKRK